MLFASLYFSLYINLILGYFFSNISNCSFKYPVTIIISGISAFTTASNNVSIIFLPFTNTNGFGVLRVIGTSLIQSLLLKR
ncbi:MAG: hypothetical protein V8R79_01430 [Candidatus Gastranaerophilaceae bacterium]